MTTNPRAIDDGEVLRTLRECLADPAIQRDGLGGGIPTHTVAQRMGNDRSSIREALNRLRDRGRVVRVHGLPPDLFRPRTSWLPRDHADADGAPVVADD